MPNDDPPNLRKEPLPNLNERRIRMRKLFRTECLRLSELQERGASATAIESQNALIDRILVGIGYLGDPDARLDLYRTFDQPLPYPHQPMDYFKEPPEPKQLSLFSRNPSPSRPPEQLPLPLQKPPRRT